MCSAGRADWKSGRRIYRPSVRRLLPSAAATGLWRRSFRTHNAAARPISSGVGGRCGARGQRPGRRAELRYTPAEVERLRGELADLDALRAERRGDRGRNVLSEAPERLLTTSEAARVLGVRPAILRQ